MSAEYLNIILDIIVLIFLGVTIYYALKLSKSLNSFRAYRQEFNALIADLGNNIEEAHNVIGKMKESGGKSGKDLEALLKESALLADELQFINEAGNNLAKRLEGLAEKNSRIAQGIEDEDGAEYDEQLYKHVEQMEKKSPISGGAEPEGLFSIQDRDFGYDDAGTAATGLKSQAEIELFEALQRNKKQAAH